LAATNREEMAGLAMADILHWMGLAFGIGVIAFGVTGFFRGLSLPPNSPEHRSHDKGENWRIWRT
jgi:hypothetical protein